MDRSPRRCGSRSPEAAKDWRSSSARPTSSEVPLMSTTCRASRTFRGGVCVLTLAAGLAALVRPASTATPRFYPDDPLGRELESQDASAAQPYWIQQLYEM